MRSTLALLMGLTAAGCDGDDPIDPTSPTDPGLDTGIDSTPGDTGEEQVTQVACSFPATIVPEGDYGTVYICAAASETTCWLSTELVQGTTDGPCDLGEASFFFSRAVGTNGAVFTAVNANGWNVEDTTAGNRIANATVNQLPWDTDVTVSGAGGGITYDITFQVQESPAEITIQELARM